MITRGYDNETPKSIFTEAYLLLKAKVSINPIKVMAILANMNVPSGLAF